MGTDPFGRRRHEVQGMVDRLAPNETDPRRAVPHRAPHLRWPRSIRWPVFCTLAGLFFLYFLKYTAGGLASWFSDDDLMNMHYYWSQPWTALLKANVFFFMGEPRPLGGVYYIGIHWIWGFNPLPLRVGALVLVSINLVLLFLVVQELSGSIEVASVSLILTGLNESFISLYYDTGMIYDVLAFFCYYGTLYYYLRIRRLGRLPALRHVILLMVFCVCSLSAKEIAVSLPIALLLYELLWHPPAGFRAEDLKRWILGPAEVGLLSGALTLAYIVGLAVGPNSPMRIEAYRPRPSVSLYLERSAYYLRLLSLDVFRPRSSGMLGILVAILAISCLLRKRHLVFASLMATISVLPLAFIPIRGGFAFYVPSLYWSLWAAGTLVAARGLTMQLLTWSVSRLAGPVRLGSQVALLLALAVYVSRLNAKAFRSVLPIAQTSQDRNRRYDQEIHRCLPRIPRGAKVLILDDPWTNLPFEAAFLIRLSYDDPTIVAVSPRVLRSFGGDSDPKKFDVVLDFVDGHFRIPAGPSATNR